MIGLLALVACTNRPPILLSINGSEFSRDVFGQIRSFSGIPITPGETLALNVEYRDPDGDEVQVYFADMPGLVTFDPSGTTGVLEVFEGVLDTGSEGEGERGLVTLVDDHQPPGWSEAPFSFYYDRVDTGGGG